MPDLKKVRSSGSSDLTKEVTDLKWAVIRAVDTFRRTNQTRRALALSFLRGVVSTIGAIVTVVIVMPMIVWALKSVDWPPILAGVMTKAIDQIEQSSRQSPPAADGQ
jgi:hypothetical protein